MIANVNGYAIDLSQLEAIHLDSHGGDWGDVIVLTLKPTMQYVKNPETNEWELHHTNTVIEQPCIDQSSQNAKYEKWVKAWQEYKDSIQNFESEDD